MANKSPQGTDVLQRMFNKNGMTMSQGRKYVIKDDNIEQLFGGVGAPSPAPPALFNNTGNTEINIPYRDPGTGEEYTEKETYNIYEPVIHLNANNAQQNPNDCGMYARALINDVGADFSYEPDITAGLAVRGEVDRSGNGNPNDRSYANVGEMYLIKTDTGLESHHGATVIASDGADHVTSEAHSGKDITVPEFAMYGSGDQSFYERHHAAYDREETPAYMQILGKQ